MPLSVITSMMFGGALLGSHLKTSAYREQVEKDLAKGIIVLPDPIEHPYECIRPEIYALYTGFKKALKDDVYVSDMIIYTSEYYKDALNVQSGSRIFRTSHTDLSGRKVDSHSYYNYWERNYNKVQVRIFPEDNDLQKKRIRFEQESVVKLAEEHGIYILEDLNAYYGGENKSVWGGGRKIKKESDYIRDLKKKLKYNPPPDDTGNSLESEYFNYHFNHPIKTREYLEKDKNPLHKSQIDFIKKKLIVTKQLNLKAWKDRFFYETQGMLSTDYVVVDYFLRWALRQKIEVNDQEKKAFFNTITRADNPINYGAQYVEVYNKLTPEEQFEEMRINNSAYVCGLLNRYGQSDEFLATMHHFEAGTKRPQNANLNMKVPTLWTVQNMDIPKGPPAVPPENIKTNVVRNPNVSIPIKYSSPSQDPYNVAAGGMGFALLRIRFVLILFFL